MSNVCFENILQAKPKAVYSSYIMLLGKKCKKKKRIKNIKHLLMADTHSLFFALTEGRGQLPQRHDGRWWSGAWPFPPPTLQQPGPAGRGRPLKARSQATPPSFSSAAAPPPPSSFSSSLLSSTSSSSSSLCLHYLSFFFLVAPSC